MMDKKKKLLILRIVLVSIVVAVVFFIYFYSQAGKLNVNKVNINNMNDDDSVNYRYLFRDLIEKERHEEEIKQKREFQ